MTIYVILTTIINSLLFLIWSKQNFLDFSIKASLFAMTVFGVVLLVKIFG